MLRFHHIVGLLFIASLTSGCDTPEPVVTYTVPTKVPAELREGGQRMIAAMIPQEGQTWFFKVTGPENAITTIEAEFRNFVETVKFSDGSPDLSELPEGWRIGGEKPMRFASINVNTPEKQLDVSVSSLPKQADWDAEVAMNVNRWRRQIGLPPSTEKWAEGTSIEVASSDESAVWVDLVGEMDATSAAPMMGGPMSGGPMSGGPMMGRMPQDDIHSGLDASSTKPSESRPAAQSNSNSEPNSKLKYDRPEGWRDGRMSTMRLAAFNVGPEDAAAEITVIPAGGDLRGNVARWLGQIRPSGVSDEVVDEAIKNAEIIQVDGRESQRFMLMGDDPENGTAIDATIVPLENNFSLFIKMTGPAKTVIDQADNTKAFIESVKF
ncbi:hypothetical protein CA13_73100 [Planctomycetes bacterium CA13]|uniref:Uncharacterized protein n=1 Tax=Novipirellula herctigrandis TaxID=2527986 RepID=A0A5C5YP87_9BACT|nr:hypothetical protein CA13_73100 [Planctomycetes bacterium CA13]